MKKREHHNVRWIMIQFTGEHIYQAQQCILTFSVMVSSFHFARKENKQTFTYEAVLRKLTVMHLKYQSMYKLINTLHTFYRK